MQIPDSKKIKKNRRSVKANQISNNHTELLDVQWLYLPGQTDRQFSLQCMSLEAP